MLAFRSKNSSQTFKKYKKGYIFYINLMTLDFLRSLKRKVNKFFNRTSIKSLKTFKELLNIDIHNYSLELKKIKLDVYSLQDCFVNKSLFKILRFTCNVLSTVLPKYQKTNFDIFKYIYKVES